jgi:NAD(P)H-hydrate epimerase
MTKIFSSKQIKAIDEYTISYEPVSSFELMERASRELFARIIEMVNRNDEILVFAGTGNNGGDGLAIARMLREASYRANVFVVNISSKRSDEWQMNLDKFNATRGTVAEMVTDDHSIPLIPARSVVIDAIFGSGLTRKAEGIAADVIRTINKSGPFVISIDVPSGLPGEVMSTSDTESIIKANHTLAIQFPRLSFMFRENRQFTGEWTLIPIGLHPVAIARTETPYYYTDKAYVKSLLRKRGKFDHKGNYGHALLAAGSAGKMGAAILAARAALRIGAGLVTCHVPGGGSDIVQIAVPEAMTIADRNELCISEVGSPDKYDVIGFGPGIGTAAETQSAMHSLIGACKCPLVIDADGLNILGNNKGWLKMLPQNTILTPHPKEFARIAGESADSFESLSRQIEFSVKFKCIVVLKGAYTSVSTPDGRVFFNSTGNPGMATAGSGDVLTGIILGLLSQGYEPEAASIAGVYLHGLAGDIAAAEKCQESVIASDITEKLYAAYTKMRE